ncbi:preprotein translocase subunit SecA [Fluviicola chungangensis]|uniref:Protein translocase subunit SecA n=1 Tax=Fluviicola chungangensis TaxID=2597671 RepID=A0A556MQQ7_9FLAO|nr:preprotein translocase subunit SecA [Fluviicola chungangensis]TSJ42294.1 preprotein translocase subunit SecA [Fluviicola chungangensis]
MLGGILKKILGDKSATDQKKYQPVIQQVGAIFNTLQNESDDALRGRTAKFKQKVQDAIKELEAEIADLTHKANDIHMPLHQKEAIYESIDAKEKEVNVIIEKVLEEILPEAFAVVKETARRWAENGQLTVTATELDKTLATRKDGITIEGDKAIWSNKWTAAGASVEWVMVHYDVQLMGGAVLHRGNIAEMQTGEGKTLVATLPVYLNALSGKGVHVVTVNDYLAKRDSEWMGPLYQFHGLTVDCIDKHQPNSEARREAYMADITFGTNNEFGFDYLRDNMASAVEDLVQRKHHFAIVDEVDSVLIDDARTPLIISGPTPKGDQHEFYELKPRVELIVEAQRKYVNQALADAKRLLTVINGGTVEGMDQKTALEQGGIALLRAHRGLPKNKALHKFLSEPGIKSHLQKVENQYMAEQGKQMKKIDVELFFVIDEKQNTVELTEKGIDLISGNEDRNFFVMPDISSEIAQLQKLNLPKEEFADKKEVLIRDYTVKSERIHSVSQLLKAYTLFEKEVEYVIMDGKIKIVDESTGRIMEGRRYSDGLHQAIEAKENVTVEAATQTYATVTLQNYFRMYHKLAGMTGTAETEAKEFWDIYKLDVVVIPTNRPISRKDDNDLVFKTAREKYAAVIEEVNKLVQAGRPVLVGTTTVEISELLSRMLKMRNISHQVLNAKYHQKEAEIVAHAGEAGAVTIATNMAGRGTDIKLGEGVKEAGGLAIIGTERHDSRRVDRQLRGRAGRQGDPGSSTFFVSLEDDLMRKFGSERIAKIMDRLGLKEGEVIQHSMVSRSIERAQKKVEENNFGVRKRLLEYDDVMNAQRKAIYKKRRNALFGDRLSVDVSNMFYDVIEGLVSAHQGGSFEAFNVDMIRIIGIDSPVSEAQFKSAKYDDLVNDLYDGVMEHYNRKNARLAEISMPQIKHVFETMSQYQNIQFIITDGVKTMPLVVSLKEAYESNGASVPNALERNIVLGMIDNEWKEHLREMDDLRSSVQQAVYEQKDPLLIYKLESFELFKAMNARLSNETVEFLVKADVPRDQLDDIQTTNREVAQNNYEKAHIESTSSSTEMPRFSGSEGYDEAMRNSAPQREKQQPIVSTEPKIGRNDPCPCGSGKKYKQCHGK